MRSLFWLYIRLWLGVIRQQAITLGPFHKRFLLHNSNSMEISICCLALANCQKVIVMEFCTWRNGWAVVACAELGRHLIPYDEVTPKQIFLRIWITMAKTFMKLGPWSIVDPYLQRHRALGHNEWTEDNVCHICPLLSDHVCICGHHDSLV